jgi:hypothetical protein
MTKYLVSNETRRGTIKKREFKLTLQKDVEIFKHRVRRVEVDGIEIDATIVTDKNGVLKQVHLERSKIL